MEISELAALRSAENEMYEKYVIVDHLRKKFDETALKLNLCLASIEQINDYLVSDANPMLKSKIIDIIFNLTERLKRF